jgi:hypothetical protein
MKKIAVLYSQHQEVARVAPEGISEIYCCAGDSKAEDLLFIRTTDGQKLWADEIQFDDISLETTTEEFQRLFWQTVKVAYRRGRIAQESGDPGDIDIDALWEDTGKEMLSIKTAMTWSKL